MMKAILEGGPLSEPSTFSSRPGDQGSLRMRRRLPTILILGCFLALVAASYGRALFRGEQFAYRDTAHFYYPLYRRVQAEWEAGRWPLWEPEENGGMPLLGNPTAAVLYPGKVLYALFRYDWGARLYVVAHTALAFAGMLILLRSWGTSVTGSSLGALSYAFGGPILFQYCKAHPGFRGGNTNAAFAVIRSTLRTDYGHPLLKPPI